MSQLDHASFQDTYNKRSFLVCETDAVPTAVATIYLDSDDQSLVALAASASLMTGRGRRADRPVDRVDGYSTSVRNPI